MLAHRMLDELLKPLVELSGFVSNAAKCVSRAMCST
jgi:hypothetical protein